MRRNAFYCTPHFKVPGDICITQKLLRFEPHPRSKHVREFGVAQYTVSLEAKDVLECGMVKLPVKDGDDEAYMQLRIRTLDGVKFCSAAEVDADTGWFLVFWMRRPMELHEVAARLFESTQTAKKEASSPASPSSSATSVPFPCLDYAREFDLASHVLLWQQSLAPAPEAPESPGGALSFEITLRPGEVEQPLLTQLLAQHLNEYLPVGLRLPGAVEWVLRYTPKAHGVSLATLYRNLADSERTLLLVQDSDDHMFGGFAPEAWHQSHRFYGSGEAFVFSLGRCPVGEACGAAAAAERFSSLQVHAWTSRNACFQYSDNDLLAMGGGDGNHALVIRADLLRGCSMPAETFGNPTLAGSAEFVVRDIEVWALEEVET